MKTVGLNVDFLPNFGLGSGFPRVLLIGATLAAMNTLIAAKVTSTDKKPAHASKLFQ